MYRACSRCGQIHSTKYKCNVGRKKIDYSRYKPPDTEERRMRNTQAWAKKSKQVRADALYLCEVCRDKGIYNYNNLEVHHITKLKDDASGLLDDSNLICLCTYHHKLADKGQIDKEYLKELAKKRLTEDTPPHNEEENSEA